jgi:hypothetical protein
VNRLKNRRSRRFGRRLNAQPDRTILERYGRIKSNRSSRGESFLEYQYTAKIGDVDVDPHVVVGEHPPFMDASDTPKTKKPQP